MLSLLRQALGTQRAAQSGADRTVAVPDLLRHGAGARPIYTEAYLPFSENRIELNEALDHGAVPLRAFMLQQTRESDLALFAKMSARPPLKSPPTCR